MKNRKEVKGNVDRLCESVLYLQARAERDRLQDVVNRATDDLRHLMLLMKIGMICNLFEVKERVEEILTVLDTFAIPEIEIFMPPEKEKKKYFSEEFIGSLKESAVWLGDI